MPLVYLIAINWNSSELTLQLLSHLTRLDYPNHHTLVVDNGSEPEDVRRLQDAHPNLDILRNEKNAGFGGGNNLGIQRALEQGADYVWLINNDAFPDPSALSALVAKAQAEPRAGGVGSMIYEAEHPAQIQCRGGGRLYPWLGYARLLKPPGGRLDFLTGTSLLLSAPALRQIHGFDELFFLYWEDADLCLRLREAGWTLEVAEGSKVFHAMSSTTRKNPGLRAFHISRSLVLFLRRHHACPGTASLSASLFQSLGKLGHGNLPAFRGVWSGWRAGWKVPRQDLLHVMVHGRRHPWNPPAS